MTAPDLQVVVPTLSAHRLQREGFRGLAELRDREYEHAFQANQSSKEKPA